MNNNIILNLRILSNIKINQKIIIENSIIIKIDESYIPSINRYISGINRYDMILPICYTYTYVFSYYSIYFKNKKKLVDASFDGLLKLKETYKEFDVLNTLYDTYFELWKNIKKQELKDSSTQIENRNIKDSFTQTIKIKLPHNLYQSHIF
jgi:hypothetical protein